MVGTIALMPARIGPKRPLRFYLAEWRDLRDLTQKQLSERLGVSDVTVSRWETGERRPDLDALAAICEALGIAPEAIYRHPDTPSADDLLRDESPEVKETAFKMIRGLKR